MDVKLSKINFGIHQILDYCKHADMKQAHPCKQDLVDVWIAATDSKSQSSAHASIDVLEALQMITSFRQGSEKAFRLTVYGGRMLDAYSNWDYLA